jgi:predicted RNA-binding Zn ribbon-like protein
MITLEQNNVLNLTSGQLCLDFANTAGWHAGDHPEEGLNSYADLVAWAEQRRILSEDETQQLLIEARHRPEAATAVLEQAIILREAIYRVFVAAAEGNPPAEADLAVLNQILPLALGRLRLSSTENGISWEWTGEVRELDRMLWPVAQSAAELLTSEESNRVGQCADEQCGWLFMDLSRNHSRRWCDMGDCGNRAKARRHYARQRNTATTGKN